MCASAQDRCLCWRRPAASRRAWGHPPQPERMTGVGVGRSEVCTPAPACGAGMRRWSGGWARWTARARSWCTRPRSPTRASMRSSGPTGTTSRRGPGPRVPATVGQVPTGASLCLHVRRRASVWGPRRVSAGLGARAPARAARAGAAPRRRGGAAQVAHGNEDTFREMLRIRRSVAASFSQTHFNTAGVAVADAPGPATGARPAGSRRAAPGSPARQARTPRAACGRDWLCLGAHAVLRCAARMLCVLVTCFV